jgi:hypothetical protein
VKLKPHREPITPGPPRPGVTPEQFPDHESAMSWFTAERQVLNASVSLAARSDFGFPAWQLALTMQQLYSLIFSAFLLPQNNKVQSRLLGNTGPHSASAAETARL